MVFARLCVLLVFLMLLVSGCAAGLGGVSGVSRCKPLKKKSTSKVWVGEQEGDFDQTNRTRAVSEALQSGLSELGVTVSSEAKLTSRSIVKANGSGWQEDYSEDSQRLVEIKLAETEIRGAKISYCINQRNAVEARVRIGLKEWHRIRRAKRGKTVVVFDCKSSVPRACQRPKLHALLRKAVVDAGLKPLSVLEPEGTISPNKPRTIRRLGIHNDAGYILWVSMEGRNLCGTGECKDQQRFAAVTTVSFALFDTGDGKAIKSWSSPEDCSYRAVLPSRMHYKFADAQHLSMEGAIRGTDSCGDGLHDGLSTWKEEAQQR